MSTPKVLDFEWLDNLFEAMFNLVYSLGMIPYRVEYNQKQGTFSVVTGSVKKYLSLFITVITATVAYNRTYEAFSIVSLRTPAIIFAVAPEVGDIYLCFTLWFVVWRRKNNICAFWSVMSLQTFKLWRPNELQRSLIFTDGNALSKHMFTKTKMQIPIKRNLIFPTFFCIFILLLIAILDLLKIFGGGYAYHSNKIFGAILDGVKHGFFIPRDKELENLEGMTTLEYLAVLAFTVFACYMKLFKGFAILLAIAGVAVVFKNACDLEKYLKTETDKLNVIQAFQLFRDFLESINEIIGSLIFGIAIVCAPTFYVANLSRILVSWSHTASPITWLTMIIYAIVLIGAAEITNKTDEFREWILESGDGEYEQQLFGMFVDLTQNPVGIRGMQCFTVTYSFLTQIFSAVVTFTIILLQFQSENDP